MMLMNNKTIVCPEVQRIKYPPNPNMIRGRNIMALDDAVKEATGRYNLTVEKKDIDRGFYFRAKLKDNDGDTYKLDSMLSIYMDERPRTRNDLTKDAVEQAVHNIIQSLREDYPDKTIVEVEIEERTLIRDVDVS